MRPKITISFECCEKIHVDWFIKLYKKITASKLYKKNVMVRFDNLEIEGDMKSLINIIDPDGNLYKEYIEKIENPELLESK